MKYTKILVLLFTISIAAVSCTTGGAIYGKNDDPDNPSVDPPDAIPIPVTFTSLLRSKANKTTEFQIEPGDEFGKFMVYTGGTLDGEAKKGLHNNSSNLKYISSSNNTLKPSSKDNTMFYPTDQNVNVDFISYFPYHPEAADVTNNRFSIPVNISDQNHRSVYTLFSDNAKDINKKEATVVMQYEFALSKIELNISPAFDGGVTDNDLIGMTMNVTNVPSSATFNLVDQTCSQHKDILVHNETSDNGGLEVKMNSNGKYGEAIFIPMAANQHKDIQFIFKLTNGDVYRYSVKEDEEFRSGTKYKYTLTLTKKSLSATTEIIDWLPGGTVDEELEQD